MSSAQQFSHLGFNQIADSDWESVLPCCSLNLWEISLLVLEPYRVCIQDINNFSKPNLSNVANNNNQRLFLHVVQYWLFVGVTIFYEINESMYVRFWVSAFNKPYLVRIINGVIFSFCLVWTLQINFRSVLIKDIGRFLGLSIRLFIVHNNVLIEKSGCLISETKIQAH